MKQAPNCIVIGVYAADAGHAQAACRRLRINGFRKVSWSGADKTTQGSSREGHQVLVMEGEAVVTVHTSLPETDKVVQTLRADDAPAIFVLSEDRRENCSSRKRARRILERLRDAEFALNQVCEELLAAARLDHALRPSAEWLLDNAHLTRTQIAEIRRHLPRHHASVRPGVSDADQYTNVLELDTNVLELARRLIAQQF